MRCRERRKKPGDVLPVTDYYHYSLPPGLKPGTLVNLIHFYCGYWLGEAKGQQFTVFQTRINDGYEYEWRGRWLPESDPRVQVKLRSDKLLNSVMPVAVGMDECRTG